MTLTYTQMIRAARLIQFLYQNPTQGRIENQVQILFPSAYQITKLPGGMTHEGGVAFRLEGSSRFAVGTMVVCLTGVNQTHHVLNMINGYRRHDLMEANQGSHVFMGQDADTLARQLASLPGPRAGALYFGHSAGGAVLSLMVGRVFRVADIPDALAICTYGSPCPGYAGRVRWAQTTNAYRLMATQDPVPIIPAVSFSRRDSIALGFSEVVTLGITHSEHYRCGQPEGGISLTGQSAVPATVPQLRPNAAVQLQRWIDQDRDAVEDHAVQHYIDLLTPLARVQDEEAAAGGPPMVPPGGELVIPDLQGIARPPVQRPVIRAIVGDLPSPRVEVVTVRRGVARTVAGQPLATQTIGVIEMASGSIPKELQFRYFSLDGQWQVTLLGILVARCPNASRAKTLAKYGNKFLRTLNNTSQIDDVNLPTQIGAWLAAAVAYPPPRGPLVVLIA